MMKILKLFLCLMLFLITGCKESKKLKKPNQQNQKIEKKVVQAEILIDTLAELSKFIPKGFHLTTVYNADLNQDSIPDKLILLGLDSNMKKKEVDEGTGVLFGDRPLLLLLRQADHTLKLVGRNNEIIYREDATHFGGDAFQNITFGKGKFIVHYFYHMGNQLSSKSFTFKYEKKSNNWFLKSYYYSEVYKISEKPNTDPKYSDIVNENYTSKDFGRIKFSNFKLSLLQAYRY